MGYTLRERESSRTQTKRRDAQINRDRQGEQQTTEMVRGRQRVIEEQRAEKRE